MRAEKQVRNATGAFLVKRNMIKYTYCFGWWGEWICIVWMQSARKTSQRRSADQLWTIVEKRQIASMKCEIKQSRLRQRGEEIIIDNEREVSAVTAKENVVRLFRVAAAVAHKTKRN